MIARYATGQKIGLKWTEMNNYLLLYSSSQRLSVSILWKVVSILPQRSIIDGSKAEVCRSDGSLDDRWVFMLSTFGFVFFDFFQKSSTVVWNVFVYVEFAVFKHLHSVPHKVIRQPGNWGWPLCRNRTFNPSWTNERKTESLHLNSSIKSLPRCCGCWRKVSQFEVRYNFICRLILQKLVSRY